jgi:hypothetical protein
MRAAKRSYTVTAREARKDLKKHVGLVHSSVSLTLIERQVFNWLLYQAYDHLLDDTTHEMPVRVLKGLIGWHHSNNNDGLRSSLIALTSTSAQFNLLNDATGEEHWQTSALLSGGEIEGGVVRWRYDRALALKLHNPSIYAILNIAESQLLTSRFSYSLYEQVVRFVSIGITKPMKTPTLRLLLGATAESYEDFRYFKQRVLVPALKEVNDVTDLQVTPKYIRLGRSIDSVQFTVSRKAQRSLFAKDGPNEWTPEQQSRAGRMRALGCSTKVIEAALKSIDPVLLDDCICTTERELRAGKIHTSASGYLRRLIAEPDAVGTVINSQSHFRAQSEQSVRSLESVVAPTPKADIGLLTDRIARMTDGERDLARASFEQKFTDAAEQWNKEVQAYPKRFQFYFSLYLRSFAAKLMETQSAQDQ